MANQTFSVEAEDAADPIILALDVGSSGTRGCLYDATGRSVHKRRDKLHHEFTTAPDGRSTIDADQVVEEISDLLDYLVTSDMHGRIKGVALDTFAASLVGVDADGRATTPALTYADSRSAEQVDLLRAELDEREYTDRTGARLHTSVLPAMLRWIRADHPEVFAATTRWMSLGEYVWLRLLGDTAVGTSTASWSGLLNRHTGDWDPEMVDIAGIEMDQLSRIADPDQPIYPHSSLVHKRWPTLAGVPWFSVIPDGVASSLGVGASGPEMPVVSFSTSGAMRVLVEGAPEELPPGLWCYRVDRQRSIVGGALNDVGRMVTWMENVFQLPDYETRHAILMAEPENPTPLVLPFLTGERATGWAGEARGVFRDVAYAEGPHDLYRGCLEGVALCYARLARQVIEVSGAPEVLRASGRVANNIPGLLQIVADATGFPVEPVDIKRSTMHGTALYGLATIVPGVTPAEVPLGEIRVPVPERTEHYARRLERFEELYAATITQRIGASRP